ncbi:MAG: hypothetical protein JOZ18_08660, partial [Chloroflexi bacterium]|nr:hypothetical protein [Chloroflexota bacterium]
MLQFVAILATATFVNWLLELAEGDNVALVALVAVEEGNFQLYIAELMVLNEKREVRVAGTTDEKRGVMSISFGFLS